MEVWVKKATRKEQSTRLDLQMVCSTWLANITRQNFEKKVDGGPSRDRDERVSKIMRSVPFPTSLSSFRPIPLWHPVGDR